MDQTQANITSAALIVFMQRWLKSFDGYQRFVKAVPGADKWAHRLFAGVWSFVASVGITFTFQGNFYNGWQFTGTIPDGFTLLTAIWNFISVFALQQLAYDASKEKVQAIEQPLQVIRPEQ